MQLGVVRTMDWTTLKWRRWIGDSLAVGAIAAILVAGFRSVPPVTAVVVPYPHDLGQVSFAVAGDVIPHQAVREAAAADGPDEAGWQALFSDVSDVFKGVDFGFVNLETPVAPKPLEGNQAVHVRRAGGAAGGV